jgi:hypothetical protein
MSIVDGSGLVEWEGGLFAPDSDLLRRVKWAFAQIRAAGGTILLNEAGRPFGVESDQYARNASLTKSGLSTVWFQWGRYRRGETPSAANPAGGIYASEHTRGIAIDCNAYQPELRAKFFAMVGLENTISSESWHWAIRGPVTVDLSSLGSTAFDNTEKEEDEDMALDDIRLIMGILTGSTYPYIYNTLDGMRHFVTPEEIFVIERERAKPLVRVNIDQSRFDGIPKRPGSRDYNGEVQPLTTKDWEDAGVAV